LLKDYQTRYRLPMIERTSENLAANIKRLRERGGLTQQELADLSGVPRPTIANLESGTANPTVSVLLRVGSSLGATLEELVGGAGPRAAVHRARSLPERKRGGALIRRLIPDGFRPAEFERVEISPGGKLPARPEAPGSREFIACEAGELDVLFSGEAVRLAAGDVASVEADQPRDYSNRGRKTAVAYRLLAGSPRA
jgi:transcriptional regulator with XRE-family HTH domain